MNKLLTLLAGGVIVVGAGAAIIISQGDDDSSVKVTGNGQSENVKVGDAALVDVDACDVLTAQAAKQILGDAAAKADAAGGNVSNSEVSVSTCSYTVDIDPGAVRANNTKGVSILARAGKTKAGADSNKAQFGSAKPADAQDVSGIGDKAHFSPEFGQLNVLKGGNWYIVSSYSGNPTGGTLDDAKALAELLNFQ